jgi:hypothetical protein
MPTETIWKVYFSHAPFCDKLLICDFANRGDAFNKVIELFEKNFISSNTHTYILQTSVYGPKTYLIEVIHSRKEEQGQFSKIVLDVVAKYYIKS